MKRNSQRAETETNQRIVETARCTLALRCRSHSFFLSRSSVLTVYQFNKSPPAITERIKIDPSEYYGRTNGTVARKRDKDARDCCDVLDCVDPHGSDVLCGMRFGNREFTG